MAQMPLEIQVQAQSQCPITFPYLAACAGINNCAALCLAGQLINVYTGTLFQPAGCGLNCSPNQCNPFNAWGFAAGFLARCDGSLTTHPDPVFAACLCYDLTSWQYYYPQYFSISQGCQNATPAEICNGIDDNCDGRIDEGCPEICGDNKDNNGNGFIDEGCPEICGDGKDNNGEGQVDEGCAEICGNGIDDNGDGQVDEECEPIAPPDASLGELDPVQEMNSGCSNGDWAGTDPVQLSNRSAVTEPYTDFEVSVLGRLAITRTYASAGALTLPVTLGIFGIGWHHNWETTLSCSANGQYCTMGGGLGRPMRFVAQAGSYVGVGPLAGEPLVLYRRSEPESQGFGGHELMVRRPNGQFVTFLSDGSELRFGPSNSSECPLCMDGGFNGQLRLAEMVEATGDAVSVSFSQPDSLLTLSDELGNRLIVSPSSACPGRAGKLSYRPGSTGTTTDYVTYEYDATCELLVRAVPLGYVAAPSHNAQLRAYDYQSSPKKGLLTAVRNEFNDPVVEFGYLPAGTAAAGQVQTFADSASSGTVLHTQSAQDVVQSQIAPGSRNDVTYTRGAGWKANRVQTAQVGLPASGSSQVLKWWGRFLTCVDDQDGSFLLRYFERDAHGRVLSLADFATSAIAGGTYSCANPPPSLDASTKRAKLEYGLSKVVAHGVLLSLDMPTATSRRSVFTGQLSGASGATNWSYPTWESLDFDPTPKATDPAGYACLVSGASTNRQYEQLGRGAFSAPKLRPCRRIFEGYVLDANGYPTLRTVETYLSYDVRGRIVRTIGPLIAQGTPRIVGDRDPVEERAYWPDDALDPRRGRLREIAVWPNAWPSATAALRTTYVAYDTFGPSQIVDPGGGTTILMRVGGAGRVTRIDAADGRRTEIRYYDGDKPRLVLLNGGAVRRFRYDSRGRPTTTERLSGDPEAQGAAVTSSWMEAREYDLAGNVALATRVDVDGTVRWKQATSYDAYHNPWKITHPEPGGGEAIVRSAPSGFLNVFTDEDWRTVSFQADGLGRRNYATGTLSVPGTATEYRGIANYTYELDSDLVRDVYASSDHSAPLASYLHDDFGRVVSVKGYAYFHDARGNVVQRTGGGRTISYEYDGLDRLTKLMASKAADGSTLTYTYAYDDPSGPQRLHTVTEPERKTTMTYDQVGRLRFEVVTESGASTALTTEYRYGADGELSDVIYPTGLAVKYVRDPVTNEITEVRNQASGTKYASQVQRLPGGPISSMTFASGETLAAGFNLRYEPIAISSGPLALSYSMTPGGNVGSAGAMSFTYDVPGRLATATPLPAQSALMRYDYVSNILREAWTVETAPKKRYAFNHDAGGNLSAVTEYDAAGTAVVRTTCFVHDALGRLTTVGPAAVAPSSGALACQKESDLSSVAVRFRYDAWNRRVARQDGSGLWKQWSFTRQGQPLAEMQKPASSQGAWIVLREYVWLEGRPIAQVEYPGPAGGNEGHVYAVHTDHLGQPRALTSRARVLVWSAPLERPFGEVTETLVVDPASGRQVVTNLRLPGQYDERLLPGSGIQGPYYNWNRWYLPSMGRYMEMDPIALAGGFNGRCGPDWYGYAEGNPLRWIDWDARKITVIRKVMPDRFVSPTSTGTPGATVCRRSWGPIRPCTCDGASCKFDVTVNVEIERQFTSQDVMTALSSDTPGYTLAEHEDLHVNDYVAAYSSKLDAQFRTEGFATQSVCEGARGKFNNWLRRYGSEVDQRSHRHDR